MGYKTSLICGAILLFCVVIWILILIFVNVGDNFSGLLGLIIGSACMGVICIIVGLRGEKAKNQKLISRTRQETKQEIKDFNEKDIQTHPEEYFSSVLAQLESHDLDFKEKFPNQAHDIGKIISAFANHAGGRIFFGISDHPRQVVGLSNPQDIEERVTGVRTICDPIPKVEYVVYTLSDRKKVLEVLITKSKVPVQYKGCFYFRDVNSSSTRTMSTKEVLEYSKEPASI